MITLYNLHQANPHRHQQHIAIDWATTFRSGLPQPLSWKVTSLLYQYVAGECVDLLDDYDFSARAITETGHTIFMYWPSRVPGLVCKVLYKATKPFCSSEVRRRAGDSFEFDSLAWSENAMRLITRRPFKPIIISDVRTTKSPRSGSAVMPLTPSANVAEMLRMVLSAASTHKWETGRETPGTDCLWERTQFLWHDYKLVTRNTR